MSRYTVLAMAGAGRLTYGGRGGMMRGKGGAGMTVEAYYDGEAVRPVGAVALQKNQRVFITIPDKADEDIGHDSRMKRQLAALEVLGGLLDDEEIKEFDKAMQRRP